MSSDIKIHPIPPIGIDTNILIAESQNEAALELIADSGQRKAAIRRHRQSQRLLRRCREEKRPVLVSVISVGEFLVKVEVANHDAVLRALSQRFVLAPFGSRAASLAAQLVAITKQSKRAIRVVGGRPVLMADTKIIASLAAAGATQLYLEDNNAVKIASKLVKSSTLPVDAEDLFDYGDDQEAGLV